VLPLIVLVATPIVGLLLAGLIRSRPAGRVRMPFTRFAIDDQGQNYWDGAAWQPIVSRYAPPSPPRAVALPLSQAPAVRR
jgi:hypothetical protein